MVRYRTVLAAGGSGIGLYWLLQVQVNDCIGCCKVRYRTVLVRYRTVLVRYVRQFFCLPPNRVSDQAPPDLCREDKSDRSLLKGQQIARQRDRQIETDREKTPIGVEKEDRKTQQVNNCELFNF